MAGCTKCIGGYWHGDRRYQCFSCKGTGERRERATKGRRAAAAASTGLLLQIDAMPTLAEVQAGRALLAGAVRPGSVVARMGPGALRLRAAARVRLLPPLPTVASVAGPGRFRADGKLDDSVVQRAEVGGRPRTYAEIFGE